MRKRGWLTSEESAEHLASSTCACRTLADHSPATRLHSSLLNRQQASRCATSTPAPPEVSIDHREGHTHYSIASDSTKRKAYSPRLTKCTSLRTCVQRPHTFCRNLQISLRVSAKAILIAGSLLRWLCMTSLHHHLLHERPMVPFATKGNAHGSTASRRPDAYHIEASNGLQKFPQVRAFEVLAVGLHAVPFRVEVERQILIDSAGQGVHNAACRRLECS